MRHRHQQQVGVEAVHKGQSGLLLHPPTHPEPLEDLLFALAGLVSAGHNEGRVSGKGISQAGPERGHETRAGRDRVRVPPAAACPPAVSSGVGRVSPRTLLQHLGPRGDAVDREEHLGGRRHPTDQAFDVLDAPGDHL